MSIRNGLLARWPAFGLAGALLLTIVPVRAFAADVLVTHRLSAAMANEAVVGAVAACDKMGYQTTAVLVDADGVTQALLRGDGAGIHTAESAHDKAYSSVTFGTDTSVLAERAKTGVGPVAIFAKLPHLLLAEGGVVIKFGSETIGAIAIAGSPGKDSECAKAGLDRIRDRIK